ncbi:MAG: hypothetical protein KZQ76_05475 [Candidatus Thiodiazotropha sp. (ex Epidulcina cf. delphinae)]|nr:hypothetical protein [Candidatus Thiodiazotropha sp. (ex Epidulcina cf. delphinae)]
MRSIGTPTERTQLGVRDGVGIEGRHDGINGLHQTELPVDLSHACLTATQENAPAAARSVAQTIRNMLPGALSERLGSYNNQDVLFSRPRRVGENEVKVGAGILQADG